MALGKIKFGIIIEAATGKAQMALKSLGMASDKVGSKFKTLASKAKFLALGLTAIGVAVTAVGVKFLKASGQMEQWRISFETMLGNADKGQKMMKQIIEFAKATSFSVQDVVKNSKLLMAMGVEQDKIIDTMKTLGDVAAGLGVPLERLALNFGQVKAQTKLTGRELRDFAIAGVPLLDELAKQLGKSKEEILEMVSRGEIGFDKVEQAFKSMAGEGGRFNNLMSKQVDTLFGRWTNLKDAIFRLSATIGDKFAPKVKTAIEGLTRIIDNHGNKVIKVFSVVFKTLIFGWDLVTQSVSIVSGAIVEVSNQMEKLTTGWFANLKIGFKFLKNGFKISKKDVEDINTERNKNLAKIDDKLVKDRETFFNKIKESWKDLKETATTTTEETNAAIVESSNTTTAIQVENIRKLSKEMQKLRDYWVDRAAKDIVDRNRSLSDTFSDMARVIEEELVKRALTNLVDMLGQAAGLWDSGGGGGGGGKSGGMDFDRTGQGAAVGGSIAGPIGAAIGAGIGFIGDLFGFERGGIVKAANGAVIPGNSNTGDKVPVMANSGEMILNKQQQGKLFNIINNGGADRRPIYLVANERVLAEVVSNGQAMNSRLGTA